MKPVIVRNVAIGEGVPKIAAPIVGVKKEEVLAAARFLKDFPVDVAEWRADWFEDIFDREKAGECAEMLREVLGETPLLFTFRTAKEGGEKSISPEKYTELNLYMAETGCVDLIDVELFTGDEEVKRVIEGAHEAEVKVVASNHDFHRTPAKEELIGRLLQMQELGADILKIAVMPRSSRDVLTLLAATEEMYTEHARCPIVTMAMAEIGMVSRISGEVFGSAMTFGAAGATSAPGQIGARDLDMVLRLLHQGA